ncbi:MAG: hypothetical protein ACR2PS_10525 [Pseudomonadales bacterium]
MPAALALEQLPAWLAAATAAALQKEGTTRVAVTFTLPTYWNDPVTQLPLAALYEIENDTEGARLRALVTDQAENLKRLLAADAGASLVELSHALQIPVLDCNKALSLQTVDIAKPWGKEIWYTGIEQRGVCRIGSEGLYCPLPWAVAALPGLLLGPGDVSIILLKILDPLPEPVYGDLYFELHEVKQEVYIVTRVDDGCWANGTGAIRIGFNQQKRKSYNSDAEFKSAYVEAVNRYRVVREHIDAALDQQREQLGIAASAVVTAVQSRQWLAALPQALRTQEQTLRQTMEEFTGLHPLAVGDVIVIPQRLPHALQHGVRTIEFQTPVYERQIVSFAQKVLTQNHWDTAAAMQITLLDPYVAPQFIAEEVDGCERSKIFDFDDFTVWRVSLPVAARLQLQGATYKLVIVISGAVQIGDVVCQPEQALLIPSHAFPVALQDTQSAGSVVLLAEPKVPKAS